MWKKTKPIVWIWFISTKILELEVRMGHRKMTLEGIFDLVELQLNEEELEDYFSNSNIIIEE